MGTDKKSGVLLACQRPGYAAMRFRGRESTS